MFKALLTGLLIAFAPASASAAPAMWEVSDGDSKVWLFGSMHLLPPNTQWRTPLFDNSVAGAEKVYFEANVGPWGVLGAVIWAIKMGVKNAEDPWLPLLTPDERAKLTTAVAPLGLTVEQLGSLEPWLAQQTIEQTAMQKAGTGQASDNVAKGPDALLEEELPPERKAYFETVSMQLSLMSAMPRTEQIAALLDSLDHVDDASGDLGTMATEWSTGDIDALDLRVTSDPTFGGQLADTLILGRNRNWVPTIEDMLAKNHQDLVIVGAAHLVGQGSVIDLLSKAGFTVTRIQ